MSTAFLKIPFCIKSLSQIIDSIQLSNHTYPTLTIQTTNYKLSMHQTHFDTKTNSTQIDFEWNMSYPTTFYSTESINHPWKKFIDIKYRLSKLIIKVCPDEKELFEPFNYIFDCDTNLSLEHISSPGFINVVKSNTLYIRYIEATQSIRLISNKMIEYPVKAQIKSNGTIFIKSNNYRMYSVTILGSNIYGYFSSDKEFNNRGIISATNDIFLYNVGSISNFSGLIEAKNGTVLLRSNNSIDSGHGTIRGVGIEIYASDTFSNGYIESGDTLNIYASHSINNFFGKCKSIGNIYIKTEGLINNWKGIIFSENEIDIYCGGNFSNIHGGHVKSMKNLIIASSDTIDNFDGAIETCASMILKSGKKLLNKYGGQIIAKDKIHLEVIESIHNVFALMKSTSAICLKSKFMENRGFDAVIDSLHITITMSDKFQITHESNIVSKQLEINSPTILLKSVISSKKINLIASRKLFLGGPHDVEYLDLNIRCNFVYVENQIQAKKRFSFTHSKLINFTVPIKIVGSIKITAPSIQNNTHLISGSDICLTGTIGSFPVVNIGTIISNRGSVRIGGPGFSHRAGRIECGKDFKFEGKSIQLIAKLVVARNTHLNITDQSDIESNKCSLGTKSYINFKSCLVVHGILHLTLHNMITFPYDIKTTGGIILDRAEKSGYFYVFYDIIATGSIKIDMPNFDVKMGLERTSAVKIHSVKSDLIINSRQLRILNTNMYAKGRILFNVCRNVLRIGHTTKKKIPMLKKGPHPDRGLFLYMPQFETDYEFKFPDETLILTEGDFTINSIDGVIFDNAEIILHKSRYASTGNFIINTESDVISNGSLIETGGNFSFINKFSKYQTVFENRMETNEIEKVITNGKYSMVYPYSRPADLKVGGNMSVDNLTNYASKIWIRGRLTSKNFKSEDYVMTATLHRSYGHGFLSYCEGGQWPSYKFIAPLEKHIMSSATISKPMVFSYNHADFTSKLEGLINSPATKIIIYDSTVQVGVIANYERKPIGKFEPLKRFVDVYRPSVLYRPSYDSAEPWINQPILPISNNWVLCPAVIMDNLELKLDTSTKFLFHPNEEVSMLSDVFQHQFGRPCLTWDSDSWQSYVKGRQSAYQLFLSKKTITNGNPSLIWYKIAIF